MQENHFGHESSTPCKYVQQNIYEKTGTNLIEYQTKMLQTLLKRNLNAVDKKFC